MKVSLTTSDDRRLTFDCAADQTILAAAEAAGYFLPAMCRDGQCGLCSAQVLSGRYQMASHNPQALPSLPDSVLLCRCQAESDLTLQLPCSDTQIGRHRIPERTAIIRALTPLAAGTFMLRLELSAHPELGQSVDFIPGQYMELALPDQGIRRAYSPVNLPNWEGRLEFLIRSVPGGKFTGWLAEQAKIGDALSVRGPLGGFMLDEASPRPRVFVAGGCGFAPILAMLRHMAEFQDTTPAHLIYAANTAEEWLPDAELDSLCAALPQLGITRCLWHPEAHWGGFTGTAAEALSAYLTQAAIEADVYVCGPPRMLETVEAAASCCGIPSGQLHAERLPGAQVT